MSQTKAQLIDPVDGTIVNADINASAAIAGTKISPDFGSQNVTTTGQLFSSYATLSAVNPTLTFTDSDNNPDYTINVNSGFLKITDSTNSADRLVINSSGHVGIGTSSPNRNLTVSDGTNAIISIQNSGASTEGVFNAPSGGAINLGTTGSHVLTFSINNSEKMRLDTSGRLLVGTTTEGHPDADDLTLESPSGYAGITLRSDVSNGGAIYFSDATSGVGEYVGQILYSHASNVMTFATASSERMRITSGGFLYVNKTSSSDFGRFEVKGGTADDIETSDIRTETVATFSGSTPGTTASGKGVGIVIKPIADRGCNFFIGVANGSSNQEAHGSLIFRSGNFASATAERLRIDTSGHLLPGSDNSLNLGSASKRWANLYTGDLKLSNEGSQNDVDSTWGNYTIQEGHQDLFLLNHRTGKKFKFNLTEVA